MSAGSTLRDERTRYQSKVEGSRSDAEIAEAAFGEATDPCAKLERIEAGRQEATREETRTLIRIYKTEAEKATKILAPYDISRDLTRLVKPSGRSREAIALAAGISYNHLVRMLNGRRFVKSEEQVVTLARAMKASEDQTLDLLQKARISGFDPLWHRELIRKSPEERAESITCVQRFREGLHETLDLKRWKAAGSQLNPNQLENSARGPLQISSLATHMVRLDTPRNGLDAGSSDEPIRISLGGRFVGNQDLLSGFFGAVRDALSDKRTRVQVLIPNPDTVGHLFSSVEMGLTFLGAPGVFELRFEAPGEDEQGSGRRTRPLRLISSRTGEVLQLLPSEPHPNNDTAVVVQDRQRIFRDHFDRRFERATPLLQLFESGIAEPARFQRALRAAEERSGPRLFLRRRLAPTIIPTTYWAWEEQQIKTAPGPFYTSQESWDPWRFERLAYAKAANAQQQQALLTKLRKEKQRRYESHMQNLALHPMREIFSRAAFTSFLLGSHQKLRTAIIDQFLTWIGQDDHYQLALVDDDLLFEGALFGLHGTDTAFLALPASSRHAGYIQVTHPLVADAFSAYYANVWRQLPDEAKSQRAIAAELKSMKRPNPHPARPMPAVAP